MKKGVTTVPVPSVLGAERFNRLRVLVEDGLVHTCCLTQYLGECGEEAGKEELSAALSLAGRIFEKIAELLIEEKTECSMISAEVKNIVEQVVSEVRRDAEYIVEHNLLGLRGPNQSFELGKVDYRLDNLKERSEMIASSIARLVAARLTPYLAAQANDEIRHKIASRIASGTL